MKDGLTAYKVWAPQGAEWVQWAKPVLFSSAPPPLALEETPARESFVRMATADTMVVVDLPGRAGVEEGLALARAGFRPVPLYNGVRAEGRSGLVDVRELSLALFRAADELERMPLHPKAPPAFLLDANRMQGTPKNGGKRAGSFDNRWCVFAQDMPSAEYLRGRGIRQVVVRAAGIQNDLAHILRRYHEKGIRILLCDETGVPREVPVARPSHFKSLTYRASVVLGLQRNPAGGFGGQVPEPMQAGGGSSGGYRYYGMG